ncbi:hypothetical protein L7F22_056683 [Adiantum nelumboides]|nr:hypothetical protein [Adiantum nelumboides]
MTRGSMQGLGRNLKQLKNNGKKLFQFVAKDISMSTGRQLTTSGDSFTNASKDISDWDKNPPSGKTSYWAMSPKKRVAEKKFSHNNFEPEIYKMMERCMGYDPVLDPPASVMDTSNVCGGRQQGSAANATHATNSPQSAAAMDTNEENDNFQCTPTNDGVPKKARKRTHVLEVGLQEASREMARMMEEAEKGKQARHDDMLQVISGFIHAIDGMSKAIAKMADKM